MARYRVALIGLGRIASTIDDEVQGYPSVLLPYAHMACYREIPAVEVVAGADGPKGPPPPQPRPVYPPADWPADTGGTPPRAPS